MIDYTETVIAKKTGIPIVWDHRNAMVEALCERDSVGAEVGVLGGNHAKEILEIAQPSKLTLIDLWDGTKINYRVIGTTVAEIKKMPRKIARAEAGIQLFRYIKEHFADEVAQGIVNIKKGYSTEVAKEIEGGSLDWVYIDAAHDYDNVIADLEAYYPKVKSGGLILGHDYSYRIKNGGVIRAVETFLERHSNVEFIGISGERPSPSFALRKN